MTLEEKLYNALLGNDVKLTKSLILQGADINGREYLYQAGNYSYGHLNALEVAVFNHHANHFEVLIKEGSEIKKQDGFRRQWINLLIENPLCTVDHLKLFVSRLDCAGYFESLHKNEDNTLLIALKQKHITPEHIDYLATLNIPLSSPSNEPISHDGVVYMTIFSVLSVAAAHTNIDILKCAFKYDSSLEQITCGQLTALSVAIEANLPANIQFLLDNGAKLSYDAGHDVDRNAMVDAGRFNSGKAISVLSETGLHIDACNRYGQTSLMMAIENSANSSVALLIKKGANINLADKKGRTALHYAATSWDHRIIEQLIESGADKNAQDNDGVTPLMLTIEKVKLKNMAILLASGVNVNMTDNQGKTALFYRLNTNVYGVITTLLASGAHIDHQDNDGNTPLFCEISKKNLEGVIALVENGADVNITNNKGQSISDLFNQKRKDAGEFKAIIDRANLKSQIDEDDYASPGL